MCGFVGVVCSSASGPEIREQLEALLPDLHHRGPDGSGIVVGNGVGLAASRLAIQGDHRSDQPVVSADGRLAVAFNGEFLASQQDGLRADLQALGVVTPPPEAGDTALLAAAFTHDLRTHGSLVKYGSLPAASDAVSTALNRSMGALAVVDLVSGHALLARDRAGIKPLFTTSPVPGELWFASELKPLLRRRRERVALDLEGMSWLARWQEPYSRGLLPFAGIDVHAAGMWTTLERVPRGLCSAPEGWGPLRPEAERRRQVPASVARATFAAVLERVAREAADVEGPCSLFLSGGLDSAAVAALCGRKDVLAITGRFAPHGGEFDESAAAAAVCGALGLRHEVLDLEDGDLLEDLEAVVRALEMPLAGPGSLALWRLARRARRHGRVVLTGTGGDELLGGYARTALALGRAGPWTKGYEGLGARLGEARSAKARAMSLRERFDDLAPLFEPAFAASLVDAAVERDLDGDARGFPPQPIDPSDEGVDGALLPEIEGTLPSLLHVEDRVLMAHGIEGRPVFCLGDLPDAALALPEDQVIGPDGEGKVALRAILKGRIPESVRLDKRKRGFPTPFGRAARGAGRDRAEALLGDRRFRERGWWNVAACRALLDEDRPLHDRSLFALLAWETWARLFVDGDAFRAPASPVAAPGAPGR